MKILIIVAMDKELDLLLELLESPEIIVYKGYRVYRGAIAGKNVFAMKSGIGKINAALAAEAMIEATRPDLVINTGVAGGISESTRPLDIVVGKNTGFHDVWCGPDTVYGQAFGFPLLFKAPENILATHALRERDSEGRRVVHGTIATGDIFITRKEEVEHIKNLYHDALAADMESASIALACYRNNVGFISIRVISDTPGAEENISQYTDFWKRAPQQTFAILSSLIEEIH